MIAGLALWDAPDERARAAALRAMAGRLAAHGGSLAGLRSAGGLFATSAGDVLASTPEIALAGDLDLTNLPELEEVAGVGPDPGRIVAELYAMDGPDFVRRLRGGFAIVLCDRRRRTLLLAVDHFGIKRLHYVSDSRRTAAASRPSALLGAPGVGGGIEAGAVYAYLNFGYVPAPLSVFSGLRRLPPGHRLLCGPARQSLEPYWDMAYPVRRRGRSTTAEKLQELAKAAVGTAMRGSPPKEIGAFLSGGTDSSTVVGLMTRLTDERVNAFSIGFEEPRYDELDYAELAARHFGAAHYTRVVTAADALGALPRLVEAYDEPFANNSALGTYFCADLARECGVSRLLGGDGGDEIFGGNERYRTDRIFGRYHRIPALLRRAVVEPILSALPEPGPPLAARARSYVRRAKLPNPERFYSYEFFFAREGRALLEPDFLSAAGTGTPYAVLDGHFGRAAAADELNRLMYLDLKLTIGDSDLLKVTRTAELAGVGVRFPLLDLPLVEFTGTWPPSYKLRGLEKRHLFKWAFAGLLPAATLAKRKHGFGVPTASWLRTHPGFRELAHDTLLSARALQRGYFRPGAVADLLRRHAGDATPYFGDILWTVLMLELWQRRHVDGEAA